MAGDFPGGMTPHAIGDNEETEVRRDAETVLVPVPFASDVCPGDRGVFHLLGPHFSFSPTET